jgi:hypothetical protein
MPPESLAARPLGERIEARRDQELVDARPPLGRALTEQATEKVDVVEDAERRIEIAAEALRHVGDPAVAGAAVGGIFHVAAEHVYGAVLDRANP